MIINSVCIQKSWSIEMRENWIRNEKIQCCKNAEEYFPLSCEIDAIGRIAKSVCLLSLILKMIKTSSRSDILHGIT